MPSDKDSSCKRVQEGASGENLRPDPQKMGKFGIFARPFRGFFQILEKSNISIIRAIALPSQTTKKNTPTAVVTVKTVQAAEEMHRLPEKSNISIKYFTRVCT